MIDDVFSLMLDELIYPLFPNVHPEVECNENGKLLHGPVVLIVDARPGHISSAAKNR